MILLLLGCLSMHKISTLSDYSSQQEKEKNAAKAIRVVQRSTLRPKTAEKTTATTPRSHNKSLESTPLLYSGSQAATGPARS